MADGDLHARVWLVRAKDGREAPEPVSLSRIRRGIGLGKLHGDMEVSRVGEGKWEPISALLSRFEPTPRADESALFNALTADVAEPTSQVSTTPTGLTPVPATVATLMSAPAPKLPPLARPPVLAPLAPLASPAPAPPAPPVAAAAVATPPDSKTEPVRRVVPWIDAIEKGARAALWLSLASVCLTVPVLYGRQSKVEAALKEQLTKAQAELVDATKEKAPKPVQVLPFASMGQTLSILSKSEGHVWLTNASPRSGVVCLMGVVTNPNTQRTARSLAACAPVAPYASELHLKLELTNAELEDVCPKSSCTFAVKDAPLAKE